ncbi:MAG: penicillin-binding protein activator [Deltaproteobacteria bacterium]|nr:penicillin-binding protein activator [Deltaproteobacteria bacterium]
MVTRRIAALLAVVFLVGCAVAPERRKEGERLPAEVSRQAEAARQLAQAEEAYKQGDLAEASTRYQQLAMSFPHTPEAVKALLRQGQIAFQQSRYSEALAQFKKVIELAPPGEESKEARLGALRCYLKLERFEEARQVGKPLFDHLVETTRREEVAESMGDASAALDDPEAAVSWYGKAYDLADEEIRTELAENTKTQVEKLSSDSLQALLEEYPAQFPSLLLQTRLARVEMESGELGRARDRLEQLMKDNPQEAMLPEWQGMLATIQEWLQVDMHRVGCLLPLSGPYQSYGDQVLRGISMAYQEVNSSAAADHQGIEVVVYDSGRDASAVAAAVHELVMTHRVAAILGPLSRKSAETAAEEAQRLKVPIITLTQKEGISKIGEYVFRDALTNEDQARALARYAILGLGYKRFAILYPRDNYGNRLMNLFWDELDNLGAEVRGVESYEPSQTDFADQIKKLVGLYYPRPEIEATEPEAVLQEKTIAGEAEKAKSEGEQAEEPLPIVDFEAVFIPDSYDKVGLIAPQLVYYDVTGVKLLGTNLWNSPKLLEMAGPYVQGAVFVDGFFADSRLPLSREFSKNYQEIFGVKPGYPAAQGYDAFRLLMEALNRPGVVSRPQLRNSIASIRGFFGVEGNGSVSPSGVVEKPPTFITIKKNHMEQLPVDIDALSKVPLSQPTAGTLAPENSVADISPSME